MGLAVQQQRHEFVRDYLPNELHVVVVRQHDDDRALAVREECQARAPSHEGAVRLGGYKTQIRIRRWDIRRHVVVLQWLGMPAEGDSESRCYGIECWCSSDALLGVGWEVPAGCANSRSGRY